MYVDFAMGGSGRLCLPLTYAIAPNTFMHSPLSRKTMRKASCDMQACANSYQSKISPTFVLKDSRTFSFLTKEWLLPDYLGWYLFVKKVKRKKTIRVLTDWNWLLNKALISKFSPEKYTKNLIEFELVRSGIPWLEVTQFNNGEYDIEYNLLSNLAFIRLSSVG